MTSVLTGVPDLFNGQKIRTTFNDKGQEIWYTNEICSIAGLSPNSKGSYSHHLQRLDEDQKGLILDETPGGLQKVSVVNESGLWKLLSRSDKPEALALWKWVTSVVLPSIRKTGSYTMGQEHQQTTPKSPFEMPTDLEGCLVLLGTVQKNVLETIQLKKGLGEVVLAQQRHDTELATIKRAHESELATVKQELEVIAKKADSVLLGQNGEMKQMPTFAYCRAWDIRLGATHDERERNYKRVGLAFAKLTKERSIFHLQGRVPDGVDGRQRAWDYNLLEEWRTTPGLLGYEFPLCQPKCHRDAGFSEPTLKVVS